MESSAGIKLEFGSLHVISVLIARRINIFLCAINDIPIDLQGAKLLGQCADITYL
jgi:hypothetical protein